MIGGESLRHNDMFFLKRHRRMNDRGKPNLDKIPVFSGPGGVMMYCCAKCLSPRPVAEFTSLQEGEPGACICGGCRK